MMAVAFSAGSEVFAIASLLGICSAVLLLLRHYLPLRSTPGYLLVPVFLGLVLPCSIVLLVPVDLASAEGPSSRGIWLAKGAVLVTWRITYWLTFLLTWWLLPLLGEYCDSGYRDPQGRLLDSLRSNAQYQLTVVGVGMAGLVYFILQNGLHVASIKAMVMALAYAWGLVLAIVLMGHGLVAFPRRLYQNANVSARLRRLQAQAIRVKDNLDDATEALDQLEIITMHLRQRKTGTSRDLQDWVDDLADTTSVRTTNIPVVQGIPAVVTERYLADLTRKLKRARHKKARFTQEWANLCQRAQRAQKILEAGSSKRLDSGNIDGVAGRLKFVTPTMRYRIHAVVLPNLRVGIACLLVVASLAVLWSEMVKPFTPRISLIGLTVVHHSDSDSGKIGVAGQIIAAAWLFYMNTCTLYAISDVKMWGNRALVKRQTYAESACWYSLQVAKLTVPLSYNFITMLPPKVYKQTSFYEFLGQYVNLTGLGQGFSTFFPCFLLLPVLATYFNVYTNIKTLRNFGFSGGESDDDPSGWGTGGWREGRALIEQEIQSSGRGGREARGLGSTRASVDLERGTTSGAALSGGNTVPSTTRLPTHVREANRQFNAITNEPEPDDGARHFYQDLGERVKNTFDSVERPEWMRGLADGISTPRWMQGGEVGGSGLGRWFGGRAEDGRVRL